MQHAQRKKRVDNGLGTSNEGGAPSPTEEEEYAAQQDTSHNSHVALLDRLISQNNFRMRGVLLRIKQKISMGGRRLFERSSDSSSHDLPLNIL